MTHVGGHHRYAFEEYVEGGCTATEVGVDLFYDGNARSTSWLFDQLWHCSDIMPGDLCDTLDMPQGTSYGQAVQELKETV